MKDLDDHHRRSIRLAGYDYTQVGAYFVTICTQNRAHLFGEIVNGEMRMNDYGQIAQQIWEKIPEHCPFVTLDAFIAMPNHIHGIILIKNNATPARGEGEACLAPTVTAKLFGDNPLRLSRRSIGAIIGSYKSAVTRRINLLRDTSGEIVWQRNYYEHIIRNNLSLQFTRRYIAENPERWAD